MKIKTVLWSILFFTCNSVFADLPVLQLQRNKVTLKSAATEVTFDIKYRDSAGNEQIIRNVTPSDILIINTCAWDTKGDTTGRASLALKVTLLPVKDEDDILTVEMNLQSLLIFCDAKGKELSSEIIDTYRKMLHFTKSDVIEVKLQDIWPDIINRANLITSVGSTTLIGRDLQPHAESLTIKPVYSARTSISSVDSSSNYSEKEMDKEFGYAGYLATRNEKKKYKKLAPAEKRVFLLEFWTKRDERPDTPENEFKMDYEERVQTAKLVFTTQIMDGVFSDRGRVLLIYGYPDEVERSIDIFNRSEVWRYYKVQGGAIFAFEERDNMGDFMLVHSTAKGELAAFGWDNTGLLSTGNGINIDYRKRQK